MANQFADIPFAVAVATLVCATAMGSLAAFVSNTAGVVIHQRPWIVAEGKRDAVLQAARETLATSDCSNISVAGLPDSHDGLTSFGMVSVRHSSYIGSTFLNSAAVTECACAGGQEADLLDLIAARRAHHGD